MDGAVPGLVVLGAVRKAEQVLESKPGRSVPPQALHPVLPPSSCPNCLPLRAVMWKRTEINPRLQVAYVFYSIYRNPSNDTSQQLQKK